ncbi:MAG: MarR family winged helix-turn-helix transcriptional regulator [Actinomycetales bacterium]
MRSDSTALAARPLHDDDRLTAMGLLEETRAGVSELLAPQLAEHGLSVLEFVVLLRLGRSPGERLRMADLATQVLLSASGLTRVIDRIENQGLVERTSCREDRRGTWAVLTPAGRERLDAALPGHVAGIDEHFTGLLEPDELAELMRLLRKVRDVVRPGATAGAEASSSCDGS